MKLLPLLENALKPNFEVSIQGPIHHMYHQYTHKQVLKLYHDLGYQPNLTVMFKKQGFSYIRSLVFK